MRPLPHLDLRGVGHVLILRYGVGDDHGLDGRVVDARHGRSGQDAMSAHRVDLDSAGLQQPAGQKRTRQ